LDYLILPLQYRGSGRPGARRRGLLLGLTPLVSEPSWPPRPGQAWLRVAMPLITRKGKRGLGFPQFTRFASGGYPPAPPFFCETPPRFHGARTISSSLALPRMRERGRPGARRRGVLLGLTPLVSEPSWPPEPGQAWLRIALPRVWSRSRSGPGLGSPQFTRIAFGGHPPAPPCFVLGMLCRKPPSMARRPPTRFPTKLPRDKPDESPALPLS